MNRTNVVAWMAGTGLAMLLAGCGGGNGGSAKIGGNVSGLAANESLVLTNNGGDNTMVSGNGSPTVPFTFAKSIGSQGAYNVQVLTQPANQSCSVSYGSGVVDYSADAVTKVAVLCTNNAPISASIGGLASGQSVVVSLTVTTPLATTVYTATATANGSITSFSYTPPGSTSAVSISTLPLGANYTVAIAQQPTPACTLTTGSMPATGGVTGSSAITVSFQC